MVTEGAAMIITDRRPANADLQGELLMSKELIELLRQRVAGQYYDQPHVIDIIARAILISRGLYPN
jgi:hypothetical protein